MTNTKNKIFKIIIIVWLVFLTFLVLNPKGTSVIPENNVECTWVSMAPSGSYNYYDVCTKP